MTKFLFIEGGHGAGTSTHADALAAALRAQGIGARAYHHEPHPAGAVGLARVVHYEATRRALRHMAHERPRMDRPAAPEVIVCDRGPWSGLAYARSLEAQDTRRLDSGHHVAAAELALWWMHTPVVMLDAADATLDARLLLRGEDPAASHGERAQWRRLAAAEAWPVVATDGDRDGVTRALIAWALRVLA